MARPLPGQKQQVLEQDPGFCDKTFNAAVPVYFLFDINEHDPRRPKTCDVTYSDIYFRKAAVAPQNNL